MLSDNQMIRAVKRSLFLPTVPGRFEALDIPGVQGRYGISVQGGFINRVGDSTLTAEELNDTVHAVVNHFESLGQSFSWFVSSHDTPENLAEHLQKAGFERGWMLLGMVLSELGNEFPMHPDVTIRRAGLDDRHQISRIYQTGFIPDKAASDLFAEMMETPTMTHYLAYLDGVDEPVGATSAFYIEEYQAVVLEASLIHEAYRGRGIYKSLIAQRLHDAYADGMRLAIVQANVASSAPALRKLGFVEKCTIQSWRWQWTLAD
jgi:GNAT superfamily N-acetyltransferase